MRIYTGKGTPIWLSERREGGVAIICGQNRLLLSTEELPMFIDAIARMTGIRASNAARIERYGGEQ